MRGKGAEMTSACYRVSSPPKPQLGTSAMRPLVQLQPKSLITADPRMELSVASLSVVMNYSCIIHLVKRNRSTRANRQKKRILKS